MIVRRVGVRGHGHPGKSMRSHGNVDFRSNLLPVIAVGRNKAMKYKRPVLRGACHTNPEWRCHWARKWHMIARRPLARPMLERGTLTRGNDHHCMRRIRVEVVSDHDAGFRA